jgi:hypothetical protein
MQHLKLLALGSALCIAPLVHADTTIEYAGTSPGGSTHQTMYVTKGKARMETGNGGGGGTVIFDEAQDAFYAINDNQRTYMRMDEKTMGERMQQTRSAISEMMAERMKNMTPEQRQRVQAAMGRMGGGAAPGGQPPEPSRYEKTGQTLTVAGHACEVVDVYRGATKASELCLAKRGALDMSGGDYATLRALQKLSLRIAQSVHSMMGGAGGMGAPDVDGVPVRMVHYGPRGATTMELKRVSHDKLSADLFKIPEGYKPMEMPGLR